jgi:hypothetical protein
MNRFVLLLMLLALPCLLLADEASNQPAEQSAASDCRDCSCAHCGCTAHCQKVCHVVCTWKDVKETVYACHCTDIAIPGHSEKGCTTYDECDPYACPLTHDYKPLYSLWNPSPCARIRSVSKLVKIEVTHKVPAYKWVVEYCCDNCRQELTPGGSQTNAAGLQPAAEVLQPVTGNQQPVTWKPQPVIGAQQPMAGQQVLLSSK